MNSSILKSWSKRTAGALALLFVAATANAGDLGELELGKDYQIDGDFQAWSATYTADYSGALNVLSKPYRSLNVYANADHTEEIYSSGDYTATGGYLYTFKVEEGKTYYFYNDFVMDNFTFQIYRDDEFKVTGMSQREGSLLSIAGLAQLEIYTNRAPAAKSVDMKCLDKTVSLTSADSQGNLFNYYHAQGNSFIIDYRVPLGNFMSENPDCVGKQVTFVIHDFHAADDPDCIYGEDGTYEVSFEVAPMPLQLIDTNAGNFTMLSYFRPGDENGIVWLEFDGELMKGSAQAFFVYGNPDGDAGELYSDNLPVRIENLENGRGRVLVDFAGKQRRPADMVASGTNYSSVTFMVTGIRGADGQYVYSGGSGTLGSFSYYLPYRVITTNISSEFTPANGSSISSVSEIEIYVTPADAIEYDGVKMTWTGNDSGIVIPKSELTVEEDKYNGAAITFAVPEEAKKAKNVKVTLNNLSTPDGLDHSSEVTATYNGFVITSAIPADGSSMAGLEEDETITITVNNPASVGYMDYQIYDEQRGEVIKTWAWFVKQADGSFVATLPQHITFYQNHNYQVQVRAWATEADANTGGTPIGEGMIVYRGTTENFSFSDVKFLEIDPWQGSLLTSTDERFFTVKFDGLVMLDSFTTFINGGNGITYNFDDLQPIDEEDGYANTWRLEAPVWVMEQMSTLALSIKAYDVDGKLVEGNEGEMDGSFLYFEYPVRLDTPGTEVTSVINPSEGLVGSLKDFTIRFSVTSVGCSWNGSKITLTDGEGNTVASLTQDDIVVDFPEEMGENFDTIHFSLPEAIIAQGEYTLILPAGMFIFNDMDNSPAFEYHYTVDPNVGIEGVYGETDTVIYTVTGLKVGNTDLKPGLYIINGKKVIIKK